MVLGVVVGLAMLSALAFVVMKPCWVAAQADWRSMVLSTRVGRFRQATGQWPKQVQEFAPPRCRRDECLLDEKALQNVRDVEFLLAGAGVFTICLEGECKAVRPAQP